MNDPATIADRIRTLREQLNMKQADLSAALGISRGYLAGMETGKDRPGRETMEAIASFFDVSLDWLARGHGDMRPVRPLNEDEALLLFAFRQMPKEEAKLHLDLMLRRARTTSS